MEEEEEASDDDEVSSTVSNWSDITGLSDISGQDWKCFAGKYCIYESIYHAAL